MRYFQDFVQDRFVDNHKSSTASPRPFHVSDMFFWSGIVLQEGHATSATRHAIIAISALVRSLHSQGAQDPLNPLSTKILNPHLIFSLVQYQKALRTFRTGIIQSHHAIDSRTALIACLVLSFFDMLHGHRAFAARHMAYGRQLVNSWRQQNWNPGLQLDPEPDSCDNISRVLLRLDLHSLWLPGDRHPELYTGLDSSPLPMEMPAKFRDIDEARYTCHLIVTKSASFRLQTVHLEHSKGPIPPEIAAKRAYFIEMLRLFNKSATHLLREPVNCNTKDVHPLARNESLKIYPTAVLIRLASGWGSPETASDSLGEEFEYIISMARSIIEFEARSPTTGDTHYHSIAIAPASATVSALPNPPVIRLEERIVPYLFFVATKCREPTLRREAIGLLLSIRWREGIWDSHMAGKLATWIMEMEERSMDEDGFIPEDARCSGETFSIDIATRTAEARCWQNVAGGGCVERQTTIVW